MASPSETIEPCENEEASSPLGHEEDQTNLPCEEVTFTTINDLSDDSYDSDSDEEFRYSNCDISSDVSDSEDAEELAELQKEILILEGESFLTETGTVETAALVGSIVNLKQMLEGFLENCSHFMERMAASQAEGQRELKKAIRELKQPGNTEPATSLTGRTRGKAKVPIECSSAVRQVYTALLKNSKSQQNDFSEWNFDQRFDSKDNEEVNARLIREIVQLYPSANQKWGEGIIKAAAQRYFQTRLEVFKKSDAEIEVHKRISRRNGRILQKMNNRLKALETIEWTEDAKEKARKCIAEKGYHSSEHSELESSSGSDDEDSDDDEVQQPKAKRIKRSRIVIQTLPWQRTRLKITKEELDRHHEDTLSERARGMTQKRERGGPSNRSVPKTRIDWACKA